MQIVMVGGIAVAAIGLLLIAATSRWVKSWGNQYRTTNRPLAFVGWFALVVGLTVVILTAVANGQLG